MRDNDLVVSTGDAHVEALLTELGASALPADALRRMLSLVPHADATLDGDPIRFDAQPLLFQVKVTDIEAGFRIGLVRPEGVDRLFRGAARVGDVLRPTSHGRLDRDQRRRLAGGVTCKPDDASWLVGDFLPRLRDRIPVIVDSERLPDADAIVPRVRVTLRERSTGLEVSPELVYGDPPIAVVDRTSLRRLTDKLVARNEGAERKVVRAFEEAVGLQVGIRIVLPPARAAAFLSQRLPKHDGLVEGDVSPERFHVIEAPLTPRLEVVAEGTGFRLDAHFEHGEGSASADAVLDAWRQGASLVSLTDGGYAPLPTAWLKEHGTMLRELLTARDAAGHVERRATAALVELLDGSEEPVPPDLTALRAFLEGGDGLPDVPPPPGLNADLRPYQLTGFRWLRFLREVGLHGVLADDMGLGKTLQALTAMLDAGGRSLVVAPTSVLSSWQREAARFAPSLKVHIYHGPGRTIDEDADITLTSYTLLRMDADILCAREWTYAVLDEAQAIKNADSLTARAARSLRAKNRLALSGTPVENRLDELWSLFRFLMPGLLGSREGFRDRFSVPIEAGDPAARAALRTRVKPYVLRRLKNQVERDLPPLTDVVVACEMSDAQRKVYEAVRLAGRSDVQRALMGGRGATMQVLEALLRLRQACCDPGLLPGDVGAEADACKLDRLEELVVELVSEDHKALVFSQWTGLLDRVEPRLEALGIPFVRLDGSTRDRQRVVDAFQSPDGPPIFLISLKAGGTGLTLTAADYVIHLDPWWNPAVQQQATDRAHRIGQDKPVVSYRLIAANTVEERILALQDAKRELAEAALGSEGGFVKALDANELRALFDAA